MQDELNHRKDEWLLVPRTKEMNVISTKWVFKNKTDEQGIIVRKKSRLIVEGVTKNKKLTIMKQMILLLN